MKTVSIFNPSFTDTIIDVLDKSFGEAPALFKSFEKVPLIDIRETDVNYTLEAELPGYEEKDVDLTLKNRLLTVSAAHTEEKKEEKTEDGATYLLKERSAGSFSRSFTMPDDIAEDEVSAEFKNGLLTVTMPKRKDTQPVRIKINGNIAQTA